MTSQRSAEHRGPELLLDLVHNVSDVLKCAGIPSDSAQDLAITVATRMAEQWGGYGIYFPKGTWNGRAGLCFKLEERDWEIYREYNRTNRYEVCAKHGISVSRLYQILTAIRRQRQAQMPPLARQNAALDR